MLVKAMNLDKADLAAFVAVYLWGMIEGALQQIPFAAGETVRVQQGVIVAPAEVEDCPRVG